MSPRPRRSPGLGPAIANGKRLAREALTLRAERRRTRNRAVAAAVRAGVAVREGPRPRPRVARALAAAASIGVLLAEGDSWFDYPLEDVLSALELRGYDVESVAHMGDLIEDMAYAKGQFAKLAQRLEKLIEQERTPKAVLLSGGGNDLAGSEFAMLLNHAASSLPPLNEDVVKGVIDRRLRDAYATILSGITRISAEYLDRPLPIIIHGYDYPVPDGRGFLGGWWFLPGPWLDPGFRRKGFEDLAVNTGHMKALIDRFNTMLKELSAAPAFAHVHYLNLRGSLSAQPYKRYWDNELHPTERGFVMVAERFHALIEKL